MNVLNKKEIEKLLDEYSLKWLIKDNRLFKEYSFNDFITAFDFMKKVAVVAELYHHHPEWSNVYHKVSIHLTTHDAGGITMKDIKLAIAIDKSFLSK
jgi:4a-hydroxytetrahydrobiopterin dehydratase